jgi:hypothetical protein
MSASGQVRSTSHADVARDKNIIVYRVAGSNWELKRPETGFREFCGLVVAPATPMWRPKGLDSAVRIWQSPTHAARECAGRKFLGFGQPNARQLGPGLGTNSWLPPAITLVPFISQIAA